MSKLRLRDIYIAFLGRDVGIFIEKQHFDGESYYVIMDEYSVYTIGM